jgi:DNA replication protein DnaC
VSALGYHACQNECRVFYASTGKLMSHLKLVKAKGTILADAVLDRIVHRALLVELLGELLRKRLSETENDFK